MRPTENIPTEENYLKTLSLSEIELEILYHIKSGLTSREISSIRGCSARTIEKHRSRIIKKLGIKPPNNNLFVWIMKNFHHFNT